MSSNCSAAASANRTSFRVGRVRAYRRGRVWYLRYCEHGKRRQPRVGPDRAAARQLAAQINAQLENGTATALGFEPIAIPKLRDAWLAHHEHVRRSSLATIARYRTATQHLVNFLDEVQPVRRASDLRGQHAEQFVRYLRELQVAPNGHRHATRRRLRDNGVKYILETCSALFNYAQRHRHLSPYAENPFRLLEIGRMPVEDARPIVVLDEALERQFFNACDDWQFPVFLTLLLTGLRPGELVHLMLPDDLDLQSRWLYVRNKPRLGWFVKTRCERDVPIVPVLANVLRHVTRGQPAGPLFRRRKYGMQHTPLLAGRATADLEREVVQRCRSANVAGGSERAAFREAAGSVWRDMGLVRTDCVRTEFIRIMRGIEHAELTAPKILRHTFATILQDANVDPLVRNQLMGHAPMSTTVGGGLGMTAVYTHTRPETKRRQLEAAVSGRPALEIARQWLDRRMDRTMALT
jgi:integrase